MRRVDRDHVVTPFLLNLAETEKWHVPSRIVASLVSDVLARDVPRASAGRQFLRILFEVEPSSNQAVGNGSVRRVVGKIHLPVAQKASPPV